MALVHSFDIGGSSVKSAYVQIRDRNVEMIGAPRTTSLGSRAFADVKQAVLRQFSSAQPGAPRPDAIAISTTGLVAPDGTVVSCGLLDGYVDVSWPTLLAEVLNGLPVSTVNDGWAAAVAERHEHDGTDPYVHVVVGTGVGGGVLGFGKLLTGAAHVAGRIGHIKVSGASEVRCACGQYGCCETFAAAPAVVRNYRTVTRRNTAGPTVRDIGTLAGAGDPDAVAAFDEAGYWLGVALGAVLNVINPAAVSVGGGVVLAAQLASEPNPYLGGVQRGVYDSCPPPVARATEVRIGRLGNNAGLIGAALLAVHSARLLP